MFLKSRLLIAAAILVGSVALASAEDPRMTDEGQDYYGPVNGQLATSAEHVTAPAGQDWRITDEGQDYYGPTGGNAFAYAPGPASTDHRSYGDPRMTDEGQDYYGPLH